MELKDMILSTLAEMEEAVPKKETSTTQNIVSKPKKEQKAELSPQAAQAKNILEQDNGSQDNHSINNEMLFLKSMRERLLVLFEGFQAPNNTNIEAKVDMTLNFLEYVLVTVDSRIEDIERGRGK